MNDEQKMAMAQALRGASVASGNQKLSLAEQHMSIAASLSNKATIMAIISAVLAIVAAVGFKVNTTVILGAAGLIVSGVLALIHAAHTHTLLALHLLSSTDTNTALGHLSSVAAAIADPVQADLPASQPDAPPPSTPSSQQETDAS